MKLAVWRFSPSITEQVAREFGQGLLVHLAFEFDQRFERHPVIVPAPSVELGLLTRPQALVAIPGDQAQQEPDLLLAAIIAAPITTQPLLRHIVAKPIPRAPENSNMAGRQAHLFLQFAVHSLHPRLP